MQPCQPVARPPATNPNRTVRWMPKRRNIACTTTYDTVLRHGVGRSDTRRPFVGNVDTSELGVDLHGDVRAVLVKTSVRLELLGLEALGRNRSVEPVCARRAALAIGSGIRHRSDHLLGSGSPLDLFVKSDLSSGHDNHDQLRGLFTSVECSLASLL